jgi:uncharacterized phage protein (TIGR02220 family)
MSLRYLTSAFETDLPPNEKIVLLVLADHADENGASWPSVERIAKMASMSPRTVHRMLGALEKRGVIKRIARHDDTGRQGTSLYRIEGLSGCQIGTPGCHGCQGEGDTGGRQNHQENQEIGSSYEEPVVSPEAKALEAKARQVIETVKGDFGLPWRKPHRYLLARLRDYSEDECIEVVRFKCFEWQGTQMEQYLRQETLFQPSKFEGYLAAAAKKKPAIVDDYRQERERQLEQLKADMAEGRVR